MTTPFREWRLRLGLTQAQAAEALGRSKRSVEMLDHAEDIPRETDLACRWLEDHLKTVENQTPIRPSRPRQFSK